MPMHLLSVIAAFVTGGTTFLPIYTVVGFLISLFLGHFRHPELASASGFDPPDWAQWPALAIGGVSGFVLAQYVYHWVSDGLHNVLPSLF